MHDAAADRPEVAHLEVSDAARALGDRLETWMRDVRQVVPRRERADVELSVSLRDLAQLEPRDVDDERWPRDPELHHRDERLPAGDGLGVGLGEQLERVVEVGRARVAGRRGNHEAPSTARIDSTIPW